MPIINKSLFATVKVTAPAFAEQQCIADCLGSLDDLIAAEGRKLDALRQHKQGLMQQLFPQPGETVPRLRFPEFRSADAWPVVRLGDVCNMYQPETIPSSQFWQDGEHLVYGAGGIIGRLDRYNHLTEEVIIGCRGICGNVSMTAPMSWITGNAMVLSPHQGGPTKQFLFHLFTAIDLTPIISGSAQPQITRQSIRPFRIAIPAPEEQQKIADCLGSLDDLIAAEGRKLDALRQHKKGLMQKLFPSPEGQ